MSASCKKCGSTFTKKVSNQTFCTVYCRTSFSDSLRNKTKSRKDKLLAKKYKLSLPELESIRSITSCQICGEVPTNKSLCIDHDHDTGIVRGALCYNCNVGLGFFKDSVLVLKSAIKYLTPLD